MDILIVGAPSSGKRSLVDRVVNTSSDGQGVNTMRFFKMDVFDINNNKKCILNFDTFIYNSPDDILTYVEPCTKGCIICFDETTYEMVHLFRQNIHTVYGDIPIVVCQTKCDISTIYNIQCDFKTSVKAGKNIDEPFAYLASKITGTIYTTISAHLDTMPDRDIFSHFKITTKKELKWWITQYHPDKCNIFSTIFHRVVEHGKILFE